MSRIKRYRKKDPFAQRETEKYQHPVPSRELLMQCFSEVGRPLSKEYILGAFALSRPEQQEAIRRRLIAMVRDGQLMKNRSGHYALVAQMNLVRGRVIGYKDGFGFVITEDEGADVYLSPREMRLVLDGDKVLIRVLHQSPSGRREGSIVEVLERANQHIVGRYHEENGLRFVVPDNRRIHQQVLISEHSSIKVPIGTFVVAEILVQPTRHGPLIGKIIEVLGDAASEGLESEVAIRAYHLPHQWSEEVLAECEALSCHDTALLTDERLDLRNLPFVTIDGADAKDFDDAVYCTQAPQQTWKLYVAIADVSLYVKPQSALDKAAYLRATSVYFPRKVLPMLPEKLSNDGCSLKPGVDRPVVVCEMHIDAKGKLMASTFHRAWIHSHARLTYDDIRDMMQAKTDAHGSLRKDIKHLFQLYRILKKQRQKRGALDFDTTETHIEFTQQGKIKGIKPWVRHDAHKMIEECMLIANVAAAEFLKENKMPTLYRVHPGPDPDKLANLHTFLKEFGIQLPGGKTPQSRDYAKVLKKIEGRPEFQLIQTVLLRSLGQAVYQPKVERHFGLAYDTYTHFTSPIRRYPDLLVHRAIIHILEKKSPEDFYAPASDFVAYGKHCSELERRADEATWHAIDRLKCDYMRDKVGKRFTGMITGVANFGVFVELQDVHVKGFIHITSLKEDYYHFDPIRHRLLGKHSKMIYQLGDTVRVLVAKVDMEERKIDFSLITKLARNENK